MLLRDFIKPFNNFHFQDSNDNYFVIFNDNHETVVNGNIEEVIGYAKNNLVEVACYWTVTDIPDKPKYTIAHCIVLEEEKINIKRIKARIIPRKMTKAESDLVDEFIESLVDCARIDIPNGNCPNSYGYLPDNLLPECGDDCSECRCEYFKRYEEYKRKQIMLRYNFKEVEE